MRIDEKIKEAVIAIRMVGVQTEGSCEGHRDWGHPYPWISIYAPEQNEPSWTEANLAERTKVEPLIDEFNSQFSPEYPLILQNQGVYGAFRIQSFYWKQEVDPNQLTDYQKIMGAFAQFIIRKYSQSS
ncbi:MAG: hypothetical protein M3Q36_02915 [bacterium]|nr:hypothetical protein [bacterium]